MSFMQLYVADVQYVYWILDATDYTCKIWNDSMTTHKCFEINKILITENRNMKKMDHVFKKNVYKYIGAWKQILV